MDILYLTVSNVRHLLQKDDISRDSQRLVLHQQLLKAFCVDHSKEAVGQSQHCAGSRCLAEQSQLSERLAALKYD